MWSWGFIVGAAFVPGIRSAAFAPRWWAVAAGVPIVCSINPRCLDPAVAACLALAVVAAAIGVMGSPAGGFDLLLIVIFAGVMFAGAEGDTPAAIAGLGWGVAVSSGLVLVELVTGWSPVLHGAPHAGLFFNPEVLAELAAPCLVWALLTERVWLSCAIAPALLVTNSRVGIAALAIGLVIGWRRAWLVGLAAVAAVIFISVFFPDKLGTALNRVSLWGSAVMLIEPAGRGLGWWYMAHPGALEEYAHSDALQALVELGAGAVFFLALPVLVLIRGDRDAIAERAAFIAIGFEALVSFPLHLPAHGFLAALLAGHLARDRAYVRRLRSDGRTAAGGYARAWAAARELLARGAGRRGGGVPARSANLGYAGGGAGALGAGRAGLDPDPQATFRAWRRAQ